MTPEQFRKARHKLGLTLEQMGTMLGYEPDSAKSHVHHMEAGKRGVHGYHERLVRAYLEGYRPKDWPI